MKRVGVILTDDAFAVLKDYQEKHKIGTRDEAMSRILVEFAKKGIGAKKA